MPSDSNWEFVSFFSQNDLDDKQVIHVTNLVFISKHHKEPDSDNPTTFTYLS